MKSLTKASGALLDVKIPDSAETSDILNDLEAFIDAGGAGYLLATARRA